MAQYDLGKVTKAVLAIRDVRLKLKREYEKEDQRLLEQSALLEDMLLKHLLDNQAKSMGTANATFYIEEVMKPSAADWTAIYSFIKENDCFEMLEKRLTKTFIQKYVEDNQDLPPGVAVHRENVVRVRRNKES